jgi:hypothetical protein
MLDRRGDVVKARAATGANGRSGDPAIGRSSGCGARTRRRVGRCREVARRGGARGHTLP